MMKTLIILSCMTVFCLSLPFPLFNMDILAERRSIDEMDESKFFDFIDANGDNFIEASEYVGYKMRGRMERYERRFKEEILPAFDEDGDKMINYSEFLKATAGRN